MGHQYQGQHAQRPQHRKDLISSPGGGWQELAAEGGSNLDCLATEDEGHRRFPGDRDDVHLREERKINAGVYEVGYLYVICYKLSHSLDTSFERGGSSVPTTPPSGLRSARWFAYRDLSAHLPAKR